MNGKVLFKTNSNHLRKVRDNLSYSNTMSGRLIMLGDTNVVKLNRVIKLIEEADKLLNEIT